MSAYENIVITLPDTVGLRYLLPAVLENGSHDGSVEFCGRQFNYHHRNTQRGFYRNSIDFTIFTDRWWHELFIFSNYGYNQQTWTRELGYGNFEGDYTAFQNDMLLLKMAI